MKKQYRLLALFLSVLLMLSALAACGAKSATSDAAATDDELWAALETAQAAGVVDGKEGGDNA